MVRFYMPKRKPVEAAEPAPVSAEPKKRATATKPKTTVAHKHHTKKSVEPPAAAPASISASHEQIAQLAYSYWEARGFQGGSPDQDWLRAESELLKPAQNG